MKKIAWGEKAACRFSWRCATNTQTYEALPGVRIGAGCLACHQGNGRLACERFAPLEPRWLGAGM